MKGVLNMNNLSQELNQFTGSFHYYQSTFGRLKLTDGIQYLRNIADCYWLIDIVESVQHFKRIKLNKRFIVWRIDVKDNKTFIVTAWNDTPYQSNKLYSQEGEYTDFPLDSFEFYQCNDVVLLKSEY